MGNESFRRHAKWSSANFVDNHFVDNQPVDIRTANSLTINTLGLTILLTENRCYTNSLTCRRVGIANSLTPVFPGRRPPLAPLDHGFLVFSSLIFGVKQYNGHPFIDLIHTNNFRASIPLWKLYNDRVIVRVRLFDKFLLNQLCYCYYHDA